MDSIFTYKKLLIDENKTNKKFLVILLLLNGFAYAQNAQEFTDLYGDYLGQTPPGNTPVVFARGIVSDKYQQHGAPSFSPDGNKVFWQTNRLESENKWLISVITMQRIGDRWTSPTVSQFADKPVFFTTARDFILEAMEKVMIRIL